METAMRSPGFDLTLAKVHQVMKDLDVDGKAAYFIGTGHLFHRVVDQIKFIKVMTTLPKATSTKLDL